MRDIKIIQIEDDQHQSILDIDIVHGSPLWLEQAEQSNGQRAALASYISLNSIPGNLNIGIDWNTYLQTSSSEAYVTIDNQMRQMIDAYGKSQVSSDNVKSYTPLAIPQDNGHISVYTIRS